MRTLICIILTLLVTLSSAPSFAALKLTNKNFLLEHDPKLLANTVQLVFRTGSEHDPKNKEGLARLSFMALLRGTKEKSRIDFISKLETLGAMADVDTQSTRTILSLNVIKENLEPALKLMAEAVLTPGLRDSDITQLIAEEKAKLSQEAAMNRLLVRKTYRAFLMKGTPWAHAPEGDLKSIDNITPADIRAFLKEHIKTGNLIVAAAANAGAKKIKSLVEADFANLPVGPADKSPQVTMRKLPEGIELVLVPRTDSATTEALIGQPGFSATDPDRFTLDTGMFVFGSDFTSRLMEVIRKEKGWTYGAYGAYTMIEAPRRHGGYFAMYAFPQTQFTQLAIPKMVEMFQDYVRNGVTAKELSYAINSLSNSYPFQFADIEVKLNKRLYEILDGAAFPSVPKMRAILHSVTREKLQKAVREHHNPDHLLIVLVGDPAALEKTKAALKNVKSVTTVNDPMTELPR